MSHFTSVQTKLTDKSCLVAALETMGFHPEVHETPVSLYGYMGDKRSTTAHIIVRRHQIANYSNDLGFHWNGESYDTIISEYDVRNGAAAPGQGLGRNFVNKLTTEYGIQICRKVAAEMGATIQQETRIGSTTTLRVSVQQQQQFARR